MKYEDVLHILQEANAVPAGQPMYKDDADYERVVKIIEAAVLAEREACAKVCEEGVDTEHPIAKGHIMKNFGVSHHLAAAIRARGEKCQ